MSSRWLARIVICLVFLPPALAIAQSPTDATAERARIAAERVRAEQLYREQEKACYGKFAVTDCLNEARARRRAAIADLRRQEVSLNDAERKRRSLDRLKANDERAVNRPERAPPAGRTESIREPQERALRSADKASGRAAHTASDAQRAVQSREAQQRKLSERDAEKARRDQEAAANVARRAKNEREAQERRAAMQKRAAERKKPPASSLPVPP